MYIFIVLCIIKIDKTISHYYLQMNTKLKLFKFWAQRKRKHSDIKSEYVQNGVTGTRGYFLN
jgi:hypothetical protein